MYDWPETRSQTLFFWNKINVQLEKHGIAAKLIFPKDMKELHGSWKRDDLIFSQTCWGPMENGLNEYLHVLTQPDYSKYQGGRKQYYRSAIIMREGATTNVPSHSNFTFDPDFFARKKFTYNEEISRSGYLGFKEDFATLGIIIEEHFEQLLLSGSQRNSVEQILVGKADIAAIDCKSWYLAKRYVPNSNQLKVVGWTSERLGLPYVCSKKLPHTTRLAIEKIIKTTQLV